MKPVIFISIGDPNGIGAEIIINIFNNTNLFSLYEIKVVSPPTVIEYYSKLYKLKPIPKKNIVSIPLPKYFRTKPGKVSKLAGKISGNAIKISVENFKEGKCEAIVTLPISKKSLILGGFNYSGHTEFLTELMNKKSNAMIMYHKDLICMPVTTHIPLSKVSKTLNANLLETKIILMNNFLLDIKKNKIPKIALLSLNPHSGENGEIGNEELKLINPVLKKLREKNINIEGVFASDGFFGNNKFQDFDGVTGMYHDQIMIPFKIISKGKGVNITTGIDLIRTSPAHGTAFDIAGKYLAKSESTIEAIKIAGKLAISRKMNKNKNYV